MGHNEKSIQVKIIRLKSDRKVFENEGVSEKYFKVVWLWTNESIYHHVLKLSWNSD